MSISITINGRPEQIPGPEAVSQILSRRGLIPERVVVELNQNIISPAEYATARVYDGDQLELLSFVGGG